MVDTEPAFGLVLELILFGTSDKIVNSCPTFEGCSKFVLFVLLVSEPAFNVGKTDGRKLHSFTF